jgi:uncharacterized protein YdhG (YjbR/CyaY superfamily)
MTRSAPKRSVEVDAYIADTSQEVQPKLRQLRAAIRSVAPDSVEVVSYRMPGFSYPGYRYRGMFVWFAAQSGHIGLYLRPPTIERHRRELARYGRTKAALHLPYGDPLPIPLIKKLVRTSIRIMRADKPE